MSRLGPDIDKEYRDNVNTLENRRKIKTIIFWLGFGFIAFLILTSFVYTEYKEISGIVSFLIFILLMISLNFIKTKRLIRVDELLSYYLYVLAIEIENYNTRNEFKVEKISKLLKRLLQHIDRYLKDYGELETYYVDFSSSINIEKRLEELESNLMKIYSLIKSREDVERELLFKNIMKMSQSLYRNHDISEEFNESLHNISEYLKDIKELKVGFSFRNLVVPLKNLPRWFLIILAIVGSCLIVYYMLPLSPDAKWLGIIAIIVGIPAIFRK